MEAIKKKVQAMKVEKDNLCDRMDEVEQVKFFHKETSVWRRGRMSSLYLAQYAYLYLYRFD
jgi:hypothetical protein